MNEWDRHPPDQRWYRISEVAGMLGFSYDNILRKCADHDAGLPGIYSRRFGSHRRIPQSAIVEWGDGSGDQKIVRLRGLESQGLRKEARGRQ
jgi:hypothetical protein